MKVTFFGTAALLFDDGTDQIFFDPHFTCPSLCKVFFSKIAANERLAGAIIERHKIERLRGIFVSHSHYDHALDSPCLAKLCGATVYGSPSTLNIARGGGIGEDFLVPFEPDKSVRIGKFAVRAVPSAHSKPAWYNDDLGKTIDSPLAQPARKAAFKEGGSFDFLVAHEGKTFLIRPSFNYIENQFAPMRVDVLFLGVMGILKATDAERAAFFRETVERVQPALLVPIHWDNFFSPLEKPTKSLLLPLERANKALFVLQKYCEQHGVACCVQPPLTHIVI